MKSKVCSFLAVFLFLFTCSAFADIGEHSIQSVSLATYNGGAEVTLVMDDGTSWSGKVDETHVDALSTWAAGDVLFLNRENRMYHHYAHNEIHITNIAKQPDFPVEFKLDAKSKGALQTISAISEDGREMTLSDGTVWTMTWFQSWWSYKWRIGNAVLRQKDGFGGIDTWYNLINIDRPTGFSSNLVSANPVPVAAN